MTQRWAELVSAEVVQLCRDSLFAVWAAGRASPPLPSPVQCPTIESERQSAVPSHLIFTVTTRTTQADEGRPVFLRFVIQM